jgi:alpha-tubulin suppressor-like RCC1 family protein
MSFKKSKNSNAYEAVWAATDLQIGSGTNWLALTGGNKKVVTLKGDGTLWLWNFGGLNPTEASSRANIAKVVPVQLGSHTDWVAISGEPGNLIALAADGSLWFWPLADAKDYYNDSSRNGKLPIRPLLDVSRKPQLIGNIFSKAE